MQWRKIDLACAFADAANYAEAKHILLSVLETAAGREGSLFLACQVDLVRAMVKLGELTEATRKLEHMKLRLERAPFLCADGAFGEVVLNHVNELLGEVYVRTGELDNAAAVLSEALIKESIVGGRDPFRLVALMRVCARYHRACGHASMVCLVLRVVTGILDDEERDPCLRASAHIDLAFAEVAVGEKAAAASRLGSALRCLRKRKRLAHTTEDINAASKRMAKMIVPRRRLRGRRHPEDVEPRPTLSA